MYSDIAAIANPLLPSLFNCQAPPGPPNAQCLGGDNGSGFGWEDMIIYKIGYQWNTSSQWAWRVGYSHGDQPIPESEVLFNILAPGVMEDHFTFGFSRFFTGGLKEFNMAFMYAPSNSITGPNPLSFTNPQTITLEMTQWEIEASFSW